MRPEVWLNFAMSQDGFLAGPDRRPVRLSDASDLRRVHAMRAAADAILVGAGTIAHDDPSLRIKPAYAHGQDPVRIVLDPDLQTPPTARVLPALVYHHADGQLENAITVRTPARHDLAWVLEDLGGRGIRHVMVEGGARVLHGFLEAGLWDRCTVYVAPVDLHDGPAAPPLSAWGEADPAPAGEGVLWTFLRDAGVSRG